MHSLMQITGVDAIKLQARPGRRPDICIQPSKMHCVVWLHVFPGRYSTEASCYYRCVMGEAISARLHACLKLLRPHSSAMHNRSRIVAKDMYSVAPNTICWLSLHPAAVPCTAPSQTCALCLLQAEVTFKAEAPAAVFDNPALSGGDSLVHRHKHMGLVTPTAG